MALCFSIQCLSVVYVVRGELSSTFHKRGRRAMGRVPRSPVP